MNLFFYRARLIRVVDGDTADLEVDLGFNIFVRERFRFAGINAYEISTEKGKIAKAYVERRFAENDNECMIKSEKTLNEEMIEKGLAFRY